MIRVHIPRRNLQNPCWGLDPLDTQDVWNLMVVDVVDPLQRRLPQHFCDVSLRSTDGQVFKASCAAAISRVTSIFFSGFHG